MRQQHPIHLRSEARTRELQSPHIARSCVRNVRPG
jgi:hypothetical protein